MKSKYFLFLVVTFIVSSLFSQTNLNDYKYVIVQKEFHFQTEPNQYDLNRIVKFLFEKYGFEVVVEGQPIPKDLRSDFCLALSSDVRISGLLRTKAQVILRNCEGQVVYTTEEGITKEKEHKRAYNIAIHKAFESFDNVYYRYVPKEEGDTETEVVKEEIQKEETSQEVAVVSDEAAKEVEPVEEVVEQAADEVVKESTEVGGNTIETVASAEAIEQTSDKIEESGKYHSDARQLFARKIENGYELTHNSKAVMTMIETSIKDVYLVKGQDGLIYKEDGNWLYLDKSKASNKPVLLNLKFLP